MLLNYCIVYAKTKSLVLQPKMSLGRNHLKFIITLIIFVMCRDVEKNPGPYNIARIVQVSFSQGHERTNP